MAGKSFAPNLIAAVAVSAMAVALLFASPEFTAAIRRSVRDATRPGQRAAVGALRGADQLLTRGRASDAAALRQTRAELAAWKLRARQLELAAALVREQMDDLQETGPPPIAPVASEPLATAELIEAAVLGSEHAREWRVGQFLDQGTLAGIPESALVLESTEPVIDQGETSGLTTGQPVYAGRCIVGRIAHAGRWMSTVQPVTHPEYRGFAQIVRRTPDGPVFGPRGILEGRGEPLCRLKIIDTTAAIEVGDHVYTGARDGTLPLPMYYGEVVAADLDPQTLEWDIRVRPAVAQLAGRTVTVLRHSINPLRQAAN